MVPNGYQAVTEPLGRVAIGDAPTVLFQGLLKYPANIEAARWMVDSGAPDLAGHGARRPGPTGRRPCPVVAALHDPPHVTVVGKVPSMTPELARADLVVVPVRYGSGTRIKILEAFAHRIPVASTRVGAEGLEAADGIHLLIGDTADELAAACARLLTDEGLRARSPAAPTSSMRRGTAATCSRTTSPGWPTGWQAQQ